MPLSYPDKYSLCRTGIAEYAGVKAASALQSLVWWWGKKERSGGALLPRCLDTLVCLLSGSLSAGGVSVRKTTKH